MTCSEYQGHHINDKQNNVALFKHSNGQFYFALYHANGSVRLRSEGFPNAQQRDQELSGVIKNLDKPEMYSTMRRGEYYMTILKDKTGREVGRSCLQKDAPAPVVEAKVEVPVAAALVAAAVVAPIVVETPVVEAKVEAPVAAAAVAVAAVVASAMVEANVEDSAPVVEAVIEPEAPPHDPEDDYMTCANYAGHATDAANSDVACFEHDGQFYFAIYDTNGNVALRGEAHPTAAQRDEDLADVLRNRGNKDRYETKKFGQKYQFTILRDENGKEIGRSCLDKIPVPAAPVDREDDYLTCNDYSGHARITAGSDFGAFKKDGLFYFAVYAKDGSVALRSEGHPTAELRDRDMKNVMDNRGKDANHTVITVKPGISYTVLKDDAGNEIGRSCLHKVVAAAASVAPIAAAAVAAVAAAASKIELSKVEIPAEIGRAHV